MHLLLTTDILARKEKRKHILVIGAGVIGLTTAWTLLDLGYDVTVLYKDKASDEQSSHRLVSQISGALWEYPPAVCGHHTANQEDIKRAGRWAMISYHVFAKLAEASKTKTNEGFGVRMRRSAFFFEKEVVHGTNDVELEKMRMIQSSGVAGFRHDPRIINECELSESTKYVDAYEFTSPVIDTDRALAKFHQLIVAKGAKFKQYEVKGKLVDEESGLLKVHEADAIVNATGFGAREVAGDADMYPLRGAVWRFYNPDHAPDRVKTALVVSATEDEEKLSKFIFIIPRNDNIVIAGGFSQPPTEKDPTGGFEEQHSDSEISRDHPLVKDIRERCIAFLPKLKGLTEHANPIAHGRRPARSNGGVRVQREDESESGKENSRIVHSYGHAGSGWSLSFGCALEVAMLIEDLLRGTPPGNRSSSEGTDNRNPPAGEQSNGQSISQKNDVDGGAADQTDQGASGKSDPAGKQSGGESISNGNVVDGGAANQNDQGTSNEGDSD